MSKRNFLPLILLYALDVPAQAHTITIEPDNYEAGADLTTVSKYATLQSVDYLGNKSPIKAAYSKSKAASGLTFGSHGMGCVRDPCNVGNYEGFGIFFNQEAAHVSLLGTNWGYSPGLHANWVAFDQTGNQLAYGRSTVANLNQTISIDIPLNNIWSLFVGGGGNVNAFEFDSLTFDVNEPSASVTEPSTIGLLALAIFMLLLRARRPSEIFSSPHSNN